MGNHEVQNGLSKVADVGNLSLLSLFHAFSARLEFKLDNGSLIHTLSGKCVQPVGSVTDGVALGLYSSCGGHQFSFTTGGSLQHVGSKKCVNTKSGVRILKMRI